MKTLNVLLSLGLMMCLGMATAGSTRSGTAVVSGLMGKTTPQGQSSNQPAASTEALIDELRKKVAAVDDELAQEKIDQVAKPSTTVASQDEITERRFLLQQLSRLYLQHIDSLIKLQELQQSRVRLEHQTQRWAGLPEPSPYSFLKVDAFRESVRSLNTRMQALTVLNADIQQENERRRDHLEDASEKLRQAEERLEEKSDVDKTSHLTWLRDLAALRLQMAEARIGVIQAEQRLGQEELAETRLRLDLARKKLSEASQHVVFPDADRELVRHQLEAEQRRLQAEFDEASEALESSRKPLDTTTEAHAQGPGGDPSHLAELESTLEIQREQAENADIKFKVLNRLLDAVKARQGIWELRWSLADTLDVEKVRQAYARIGKAQTELKPIKEYVEQRMKLTGNLIHDLENRSRSPVSPQWTVLYQQLNDLYLQREASLRRLLLGIETTEQLLDLWKQDLDDRRSAEPLSVRMQEWLAEAKGISALVWQFELFAVQDTIEVDGQAISGKRSVTVGKVLTALLILVIGFWIAVRLSHRMARIAVRRIGMDASHARIARRWVLFLVGAILLVTSLGMVKIPLTVFAFLGGAVAIGAGFGMQNLLKNLISGLMLLLERPFRPGDLVEVGAIRGRVMDIGMRSSHIRDGNGIETVIPNSTFVEQNVTNWTLSSQSVRIVVKIGIAYGSPVDEVTGLLLEVANRHGLVQDKPPPQVLFEDFGGDALLFGLYVWLELKPEVDWRTVASDLRYMINKTLAAKNIVNAFPQRDVHLDVSRPLDVRVHVDDRGHEN